MDIPPSVPPERPVTRRDLAGGVAHDLVVRGRTAAARRLEAVAELDALDGLDPHQRRRQAGIEPPIPVDVAAKARRQPVGQHLDDAAESVALALGGIDLRDHRRRCRRISAAHRVGIDAVEVTRARAARCLAARRPARG